jgi:hypothetical protein
METDTLKNELIPQKKDLHFDVRSVLARRFSRVMKHIFTLLSLVISGGQLSALEPLLAIPGKVLFEAKLDTSPAAPWKMAKGKWEPVSGVLQGSELAADHHGAVMRAGQTMQDCIIEFEVKFSGAKSASLTINAKKDHMARIAMNPKGVTIQRDDNDHGGPDKAIIFHRVPANLADDQWHTVRMEMVGDTMLGKVDGIIGWGADPLFTQEKYAPGLTVGGESAQFRNFKICEATKNPQWDQVKQGIKNELTPVKKGKAKSE